MNSLVDNILSGRFASIVATRTSQWTGTLELCEWLKTNRLNKEQAANVAKFMHEIGIIPKLEVWSNLQTPTQANLLAKSNLFMVHALVQTIMVQIVSGDDLTSEDILERDAWMYETRTSSQSEVLAKFGYL